jgi:hypothetical protein
MSRKLTVNVEHIDPRNGDQFGFEIINNGNPLTFTSSGVTTSSYTKTFVNDTTEIYDTGRILSINSGYTPTNILQFFNGNVYDIGRFSDGKIVIVGNFTQYGGTVSERIIILNSDYTVFRTYPLGTGANGIIRTLVINNDNTLFIGGEFTTFNTIATNRIAKLNTSNNLDISFTNTIMSAASNKGFNASVNDIILIGGNIYITGVFNNFNNNSRFCLISLTTSGNINSVFNVGSALLGGFGYVLKAVENNTRIIVGGDFIGYKFVTGKNRIIKLDLNANEVPAGFESGFNSGRVDSIAIDSTNNLYIGGSFTSYKGLTANKIIKTDFLGTRFSFFGNGVVGQSVLDIEVLANGKISLVGLFSEFNGNEVYNNVLCNSDGSFDKTIIINDTIRTVLQPITNNLLFGGDFNQTTIDGVAQQTITTIPIAANIIVNFGTGFNGLNITLGEINNKIYCGGFFTTYQGTAANRIISLNPDGSINTDFDYGSGFNASVVNLTTDNDKLYYVGSFTSYNGTAANRVISINLDGTINTDFNYGTGFNNEVSFVRVYNNKIYLIGSFTSYNGTAANRVISLNLDGTINTDFAYGTGFNQLVSNIEIVNDIIYLVGNFTTYKGIGANRIISLNLDGSINTDFDYGTGFNNTPQRIYFSDNFLYVVGNFTTYKGIGVNRIISLNLDGSINSDFDYGTGFNNIVWDIIEFNDKLYVIGSFTSYQGTAANRIISLNLDGSINGDFDYGTGFDQAAQRFNIIFDKIYICGSFTTYKGLNYSGIVTLNEDGSPVTELLNLAGTVQNTFDNFELFHDLPGITHSIQPNNIVRMEYEFDDEEIVINNIYDTPQHVELTFENESLLITDVIDEVVVRSPHFITTTETEFDTVNYKIRVFEGNIFSASTFPILYEKTKQKIITQQNSIYINISNLCRENLEASALNFLDLNLQNAQPLPANMSKWVQVDYESFYTGTTVDSYIKRLFVMDGYLDPTQDQEVPKLLFTGDRRYINRNQNQRVYFQANRLVRAFYSADGFGAQLLNWDIDIFDNKKYVQSVKVDTTEAQKFVDYIFIYEDLDGGEFTKSIRFNIYDECRYPINSLVFKNKWGVLESLPVTKKIIETLNKNSNDFQRSIVDFNGNYDITRHTNKQFNVFGETQYDINTEFLPEYMNVPVKEMFLSEEMWLMTEDDQMVPVILDTSSQVFKTSNNDGLIQYTFKIKQSHQDVKNII